MQDLLKVRLQIICLLYLLIQPLIASAGEPLSLSATPTLSNDGKINISWSLNDGQTIQIQQDVNASFNSPETLYTGSDTATVRTGLLDGEYFFRARIKYADYASDWGEPVSVTVQHHSLTRAFSFFLIGAIVFLATLLLIVVGSRQQRIQTR